IPHSVSSCTPSDIVVTIYPASFVTKAPQSDDTRLGAQPVVETPVPVSTLTIAAPQETQYTVVQDDTLWGIAMKFNLSLNELIVANPKIDPDQLFPGDVLVIPAPGTVDLSQLQIPTDAASTMYLAPGDATHAYVAPSGGGLRLREAPSTAASVITKLQALAALTVLGQTQDGHWFNVTTENLTTGWVMSQYIVMGDAPRGTPAAESLAAASTSDASIGQNDSIPSDVSYISGITAKARQIFETGRAKGNRANVFALVGDSNTVAPYFLTPFDRNIYQLGNYGYLEETIRYFKGSFYFDSAAAVIGFTTANVLDPGSVRSSECAPGESPLVCEYRRKRPSVALILLGTNDCYDWGAFERRYRSIVEYTIEQGIIPVLITKADDLEAERSSAQSGYINAVIAQISREYGVPLLDLRAALANTPNRGLGKDGYHYNMPPDGRSTDLTGDHLNYGFPMRNLTALQVLDALRRSVLID
ncbi:MAG: LysM peptidoglycan-binding domain-containing protein, partial [Chloroflexi bacterium]|nr:LysM peptidoglycan-binding domain-containing protein [Chloroflexota bacterium]